MFLFPEEFDSEYLDNLEKYFLGNICTVMSWEVRHYIVSSVEKGVIFNGLCECCG